MAQPNMQRNLELMAATIAAAMVATPEGLTMKNEDIASSAVLLALEIQEQAENGIKRRTKDRPGAL